MNEIKAYLLTVRNSCLKFFLIGCVVFFSAQQLFAQRQYAANSVLANGNFIKIAVGQEGIYKVDVAFIANAGFQLNNISSSTLRFYGNGGAMLSELNNSIYTDDLIENAILVVDGGDGIFNNNDYFLFYAPGPQQWLKDSTNQKFQHKKNLYSDSSYYFITIGGNGKRITTKQNSLTPNQFVSAFDERYFYENDLVNFLNSGKEWYGEEFSNISTNNLTRNFAVDIAGAVLTEPINFSANLVGRSVGAASSFILKANNGQFATLNVPANSGNFLDAFAANVSSQNSFISNTNSLALNISFNPATASAQGWLNWFEIQYRKSLSMPALGQLFFRDWKSVGFNNAAEYTISNASSTTEVWDITNPSSPEKMTVAFAANQTKFVNNAARLREYVAYNNTAFLTPVLSGKIENHNLHNSTVADYLIITHSSLLQEAKRLALFHTQRNNYRVFIAITEQIFNEFSSGSADPTALRDFVKMYYDKAGNDTTKRPKYLLLFGAASFDYKKRISGNTNLVPCYQNPNSLDPLQSYTSDDFFGLLDDADNIDILSPPSLIDIGIGRIPATTAAEAKIMVDKIINYHSKNAFGAWRNNAGFVADDKDNNTHLNDAEFVSLNAATVNATINNNKIYLDAYPLVNTGNVQTYPEVENAVVNQLYIGSLLLNYNGHGGYQQLADEKVFDKNVLEKVYNANKLPLFITATCDFAPYDDPTKTSLGSQLLMQNSNGAIALMTTTRTVFAFSNRVINNNYLNIALRADANGKYLTLGEAAKRAKNYTYQTFSDVYNNRKFTLLGDPAMKLALPENKLQLTSINNQNLTLNDTLKATNKYSFGGRITDASGNQLTNFNGTLDAVVFDKPQIITTKANDITSPATSFSQQTNFLYKGKATVINGNFSFSFIVPKDINTTAGKGKLSLYADDGAKDAAGFSTSFFIGGIGNTTITDKTGPLIKGFLNDERFVNGGLTNDNPILISKLNDSSGINTLAAGMGHDITAVLDGDEKKIITLNNYYESALNDYQNGQVRYQLPTLSDGPHTLKIKAWDVFNNPSEITIEFTVAEKADLQISHVYNYPNPFTSKTTFWFEHNQPGENLDVLINIFSVTGKLVHQVKRTINNAGNRSAEIDWDGKDLYSSEKLGRGVYIYRIIVTSANGRAEATQKLYLL